MSASKDKMEASVGVGKELKEDLIESKGTTIAKKGDFVTFEPGSTHSSYTKNGCLILVFMRGVNKLIEKNNVRKI